MTEVDIERMKSTFWNNKCKVLDIGQLNKLDTIVNKLYRDVFKNADKDKPVSAFRFASWLDTGKLKSFFKNGSYVLFDIVEERLDPRIKFTAAMCMGKYETPMDAFRVMISEGYWRMLGFSEQPNYELLREFVYERIGIPRLQEFFNTVVVELIRQGKQFNLDFGTRTGEDATDTTSLKYDNEAVYSGYYKHNGYKMDVIHDMNDKTVPLDYLPMRLTDDEGKNLIPSQERLRLKGIKETERKVDGAYVKSLDNIAKSEMNGVHLVYKKQKNWTICKKGTEENIKKQYQKYHVDENFRSNATILFMLDFLHKKGRFKSVGAYFRNQRMKYIDEHPELSKKETGERSNKTEGFFSVTKNSTILDSRPRRRGWKEFVRRCGFSMLAHVFAALIRIQHGVKIALGCVTYLT